MKTLGTPDATAETFPWMISATETAGTDYRVLVWQGINLGRIGCGLRHHDSRHQEG